MKSGLAIVSCLTALMFAGLAPAQEKDSAVVVDTIEAVVTVVDVNHDQRIVTVRGPGGRLADFAVPPEAQNLDQVHPGSRFKVRYLQSVAVSIRKGGTASSSSGRTVNAAPKGDTPGGVIVNTRQITGVVESIDYGTRFVSVRAPEDKLLAFTVDEHVQGLEEIQAGDSISVEYTESLALRMIQEK